MNDNTFSIDTSLRLEGYLTARYQASVYAEHSFQRLSNIVFYDAEVNSAKISDGIIPQSLPELFTRIKSLEVEIQLADVDIPSEFRFYEDLKDVRIYNAVLKNQVNDGEVTYGEISAEIFGYLDYETKIIEANPESTSTFTHRIKGTVPNSKTKPLKRILSKKISPIYYVLFLILFFGSVYVLSNWFNGNYSLPEIGKDEIRFISMKPIYGQKYVNISVNGTNQLFLLDTGASTTTVSSEYINELIRSGYINRNSHFKGYEIYSIADGSRVRGAIWRIPLIKVGTINLKNVEFVALEGSDTNLLGMSTLELLGDYIIDPSRNRIEIR